MSSSDCYKCTSIKKKPSYAHALSGACTPPPAQTTSDENNSTLLKEESVLVRRRQSFDPVKEKFSIFNLLKPESEPHHTLSSVGQDYHPSSPTKEQLLKEVNEEEKCPISPTNDHVTNEDEPYYYKELSNDVGSKSLNRPLCPDFEFDFDLLADCPGISNFKMLELIEIAKLKHN